MSDKRVAQRSRTFLKAEIDINGGLSSLTCIVRDLSDTGARIVLSDGVALPDAFRIHLSKPDRWVQAHVRWRRGELVGIHFETDETLVEAAQSFEVERVKALEAEVKRLRRMLEEIRADPTRLHQILDTAA